MILYSISYIGTPPLFYVFAFFKPFDKFVLGFPSGADIADIEVLPVFGDPRARFFKSIIKLRNVFTAADMVVDLELPNLSICDGGRALPKSVRRGRRFFFFVCVCACRAHTLVFFV